jgi:hypothetical protein
MAKEVVERCLDLDLVGGEIKKYEFDTSLCDDSTFITFGSARPALFYKLRSINWDLKMITMIKYVEKNLGRYGIPSELFNVEGLWNGWEDSREV